LPNNADLRKYMSSSKLLNELQGKVYAVQVASNARDTKQEIMIQKEKTAYINQNIREF